MIFLGTSSWQFEGWQGSFYPGNLPKDKQLSFYASRFPTVEVNTSYYGLPRPTTLIKWVETTPQGFTFCLKGPRSITHEKQLRGCEEDTKAFLEVLRSLGPSAAPGFLQFPATFTRQMHGKVLATYLDWLAIEKGDAPMAIEVRSADLMTAAFAAFLAERNFGIVLVDRIHTIDMYDIWHDLIVQQRVPNYVIVRWIGDDQNGPKGERELTLPRDDDLQKWSRRLIDLHNRGITCYGYMHNPYEGHSPTSVERLREYLSADTTLSTWPPLGTRLFVQTSLL